MAGSSYVIDQGNWRVVVIDTTTRERLAMIPTGANPLALTHSDDGQRLYFTNSGLFEFKLIARVKKEDTLSTGLHFLRSATHRKCSARNSRGGYKIPGSEARTIFVIEDDAQDLVDHVLAGRSPMLVISPYVRRGFVSHRHCRMASVQKAVYEMQGIGSLNLEDALAAA
jgi:YVTN family beta-propeller protein